VKNKQKVIILLVIVVLSIAVVGEFIQIQRLSSNSTAPQLKDILKDSSSAPPPEQATPERQPFLQLLFTNKALHFASVNYEFEGTIKDIDIGGGQTNDSKKIDQIHLTLGVGSGKDTIPVNYPKEAVDKIKVYNQTSASKDVSTLESLKKGDLVIIKSNTSILRKYPNNYNTIEITRINP
jgi:hypothetical protein